jgi:predicted DNA-binding ribbon-helix-helix protein
MDGAGRYLDDEIDTRIALRHLTARALERGDKGLAVILGRAIAEIDERIDRADRLLAAGATEGPCAIVVRHLTVNGERIRLALERDFWLALDRLADDGMMSIGELCDQAVARKRGGSVASAIRIYILHHYAYDIRLRSLASVSYERARPETATAEALAHNDAEPDQQLIRDRATDFRSRH